MLVLTNSLICHTIWANAGGFLPWREKKKIQKEKGEPEDGGEVRQGFNVGKQFFTFFEPLSLLWDLLRNFSMTSLELTQPDNRSKT